MKKKSLLSANHKENVIHHGNTRIHASLATRMRLLILDWKATSPPIYSIDFALKDNALFWSSEDFFKLWNHVVSRKMPKGSLTEWMIFDWLSFFSPRKNEFYFPSKNRNCFRTNSIKVVYLRWIIQ